MIKSLAGPILVALLLLAGAAATGEPAPPDDGYRLQAGDVLQVSVWKETELQHEVLVRPDGGISFPLAGEFVAAGHTVGEVRAELEARLRRLIPDASVSVALKLIAGNRIFVIGKVTRPGDFAISRPVDVMQALSLAGGTTPFADLNDIKILRRKDGRQIAIPFRYMDVQRGQKLEQNVILQGGDTVVVP